MNQRSSRNGTRRTIIARAVLVVGVGCASALAVMAQPALQGSAVLIAGLRACRALTASTERSACYDAKVDALLGALDSGDVRLVDREQIRKTKRQLFGITMPDIDILNGDGKDEEEISGLFETTIASGRQTGPATWRFTTAEGAVWEINTPPRKIAPIAAGDKAVFKKASLGYYFIRINGQLGVKGRRVS
jgi:hypothetical protein